MFLIGLGDQIMAVPTTQPGNLGLEVEDADLEVEQMQSLQEELAALRDDSESDCLSGEWIHFARQFTGKFATASASKIAHKLKSTKDLSIVPERQRGEWYRGMELITMSIMRAKLKGMLTKYQRAAEEYQVMRVGFRC